jgi:glycosyltransferase involved in cell wall biosynthesis
LKANFLVSHPTGNNFVRALVEELFKAEKLENFFTTIGFGCDAITRRCVKNRRGYNIPDNLIKKQVLREIIRLSSFTYKSYSKKKIAIDKAYRSLDERVAKNLRKLNVKVLHTYEDCANLSFREAKQLGIHCSYELPIAHWTTARRLLAEEAERYPDWEITLENNEEPEEKLIKKDEELELADSINCPSRFVLESLPNQIRQNKPCQVSFFGSPFISFKDNRNNTRSKEEKLKILFVGSMTQRKGLADIFEALKLLKDEPVSLSILGQPSMPLEFYREKFSNFTYFSPRSYIEVQKVMQSHDILVLPSIIEGRALVQQEALACGLPIIVTRNAGAEDLIEEGITGSLVPIRNPHKIAQKIHYFMENSITQEIRNYCIKKSASYKWETYAKKIIDFPFSNKA